VGKREGKRWENVKERGHFERSRPGLEYNIKMQLKVIVLEVVD
jgi:hypothetical protein